MLSLTVPANRQRRIEDLIHLGERGIAIMRIDGIGAAPVVEHVNIATGRVHTMSAIASHVGAETLAVLATNMWVADTVSDTTWQRAIPMLPGRTYRGARELGVVDGAPNIGFYRSDGIYGDSHPGKITRGPRGGLAVLRDRFRPRPTGGNKFTPISRTFSSNLVDDEDNTWSAYLTFDGRRSIYRVTQSGVVQEWALAGNPYPVRQFTLENPDKFYVSHMKISADGQRLFVARYGWVSEYDVATMRVRRHLNIGSANLLAVDPAGLTLACLGGGPRTGHKTIPLTLIDLD